MKLGLMGPLRQGRKAHKCFVPIFLTSSLAPSSSSCELAEATMAMATGGWVGVGGFERRRVGFSLTKPPLLDSPLQTVFVGKQQS